MATETSIHKNGTLNVSIGGTTIPDSQQYIATQTPDDPGSDMPMYIWAIGDWARIKGFFDDTSIVPIALAYSGYDPGDTVPDGATVSYVCINPDGSVNGYILSVD